MKNENKNEWSLLSSSLAIWNLYTSRNNYVGDCNMWRGRGLVEKGGEESEMKAL